MPDFYNVYRGQDGVFDYENPVAVMALEDEQVTIPDQDLPPNTTWHYIRRRVSGDCELESPDSPACIVRIDSNGEMLGSIPNTPTKLAVEGLADGKVKLRWRYAPSEEEIAPAGFHIYIDSGAGFDFETPDAIVPYRGGGPKAGEFDWTSESLTHGELYRFCVRSYRLVAVTFYEVTGTLDPDVTGNYFYVGVFNNQPYYRRADGQWYIFYYGYPYGWEIAHELGGVQDWMMANVSSSIYVEFSWVDFGTGHATVSAGPPEAVESQNTNSVSITADAVGPDAITNLIAAVEEI